MGHGKFSFILQTVGIILVVLTCSWGILLSFLYSEVKLETKAVNNETRLELEIIELTIHTEIQRLFHLLQTLPFTADIKDLENTILMTLADNLADYPKIDGIVVYKNETPVLSLSVQTVGLPEKRNILIPTLLTESPDNSGFVLSTDGNMYLYIQMESNYRIYLRSRLILTELLKRSALYNKQLFISDTDSRLIRSTDSRFSIDAISHLLKNEPNGQVRTPDGYYTFKQSKVLSPYILILILPADSLGIIHAEKLRAVIPIALVLFGGAVLIGLGVSFYRLQGKYLQRNLQHRVWEKETLLRESNHRIKNSLQMVNTLIEKQLGDGPENHELKRMISTRLQAFSHIHDKLYKTGTAGKLYLDEYLRDICENTVFTLGNNTKISTDFLFPHIKPETAAVIPLALICTEIIINAIKHGSMPLKITLHLNYKGSFLELYSENSVGTAKLNAENHSGTHLMEELSEQLGGTISFISQDNRFTVQAYYPI